MVAKPTTTNNVHEMVTYTKEVMETDRGQQKPQESVHHWRMTQTTRWKHWS